MKPSLFKKTLLLLSAATILVVGCKKEDPVPTPTPTPNVPGTSNLSSLFDDNISNKTQTCTIDAATWNSIEGAEGTRVFIPANSFQDASGTPVSGSVEIKMVEILTLADAILTNKPTISNGSLLTTGGELNINAYQGGDVLGLTPGANITFTVPTTTPDNNMGLFLGTPGSNVDVNWVPSDSLGVTDSVIVAGDTTGSGGWSDYYWFDITGDSLGWINCDYFYGDPNPMTDLSIIPNSGHDETNTMVWIHVASANSVAPTWWDMTDSFDFNSIPETTNVTIVAISEISGQYYSAIVPITVSTNHVENITLNATTLAQFETDLDNL